MSPLPAWIDPGAAAGYVPAGDRDRFLRRNLLALLSMLEVFAGGPHGSCPAARAAGGVPVALRLLGVIALVAMVGLARNMAFVWLVLAAVLLALVLRPARETAAVARPALVLAVLSASLMLPAALLGQPSVPVRMACKSFVTCSLVLGLARSTGAHDLVAALRRLGLPATACLVLDLAIRDLSLLGRTAADLTESLSLRCVGRDRDKTASAAGVVGVTFLKAHDLAQAQAEAMACRCFDGDVAPAPPVRVAPHAVAYLALLVVACAAFVRLEGAMA